MVFIDPIVLSVQSLRYHGYGAGLGEEADPFSVHTTNNSGAVAHPTIIKPLQGSLLGTNLHAGKRALFQTAASNRKPATRRSCCRVHTQGGVGSRDVIQ